MNEFRDPPDIGPGLPYGGQIPEIPLGGSEGEPEGQAFEHPLDADTSSIGNGFEQEGTDIAAPIGIEIPAMSEAPEPGTEATSDPTKEPVHITGIRTLHRALRATTLAHATDSAPAQDPDDTDELRTVEYERPLSDEAVPGPVREALQAVAPPTYDNADITYTQRTQLTESGETGEQTTSVQFEREERIGGEAVRTTEVRYDVSYEPTVTEQGLTIAHYGATRTATVTSGTTDTAVTPLVARAGNAPLAPGEERMSRTEAWKVTSHIASQTESDLSRETDLPSRGHELAGEPIEVTWAYHIGDTDPTVYITIGGKLPDGEDIASYRGTVAADNSPEYDPGLLRGPLYVHSEFRQAGLANRLVMGMAQVAIDSGMERLYGPVESPHTVRAFSRITEPESLHFSDVVPTAFDDNGEPTDFEMAELPMTTEQAIASLERLEEISEEDERDRGSIHFTIDTAGLRRDMLETPVHVTPPLQARTQEAVEAEIAALLL